MEQPRGALAAWLMFLIVPLAITGLSLAKGHEWRRRAALQELRFQLRQEARHLLARADPSALIRAHFSRGDSPGTWPASLFMELSEAPSSSEAAPLMPLLSFFAGGPTPEGPTREALRHLLGWETDLDNLREHPNHPLPVRWGRNPAWLIWEPASPALPVRTATCSLRIALYQAPAAFWRVSQVIRAAQFPPGWAAAVIDRHTRRWLSRHQPDWKRVQTTWHRAHRKLFTGRAASAPLSLDVFSPRTTSLRHSMMSKRRISRTLTASGPTRTAGSPPEEAPAEDPEEALVIHLEEAGENTILILQAPLSGWPPSTVKAYLWGGLSILALALTLAWRHLNRAWSSAALRTKFLGIFGYTVGLPLLGVAVLAQGMLADRQETRIQATFLAAREALLAFDEAFRLEEAETALRFRRFLHHPALAAGHFPEVASHLRRLLDEGWIDRAELRSWETAPLLSLERGRPDPGFAIFTEMMCRNAIQAFVGPGRTRFAHESMVHIMANAVLESPELGFVEITRKPEKLQLFQFGPSLFYWFWTLRRDPASPWAFLNLTRSHRQAARRYLERHLIRNRAFRLIAWDRETGRWLPAIRSTEGLTALVTGVARTGEDQVARLLIRGRPYLAFAMPGHRLARFDLVALFPEDAIWREPRRIMEAIAAGMGLALLAGVLCALLLADSLLVPLENLSQGVLALSRRHAEHRIPVCSDDEMGHLTRAFNHMLETIGEIDLAKVVQDCLIPTAFPPPPGYRCDLRLAKVVSIGGTYFDHLVLPDGREILLIGDVAGVGVGAGLVMAMAKALTFHHFAAQAEPEALLPRMGHTFMELIPTRRLMSMCLVCLEPDRHMFQVWSAGHAPPLLWRKATGAIDVHRHPSHPLGFRKIRIGHTPPRELKAGDLLLIYSDEVYLGLEGERPSLEERLAAAAPHGPTAVVQSLADAIARLPPERRDRDTWVIFALQRLEESG